MSGFSRSCAAWYTLVLVTVGTGAGIYAIHRSQQTEREVGLYLPLMGTQRNVLLLRSPQPTQNLHKGVLRDQELYMLKKAQHKLLEAQQANSKSE